MKEGKRDFKGVWIPKEIWKNKELTLQEKVFLIEIDSLDNEDGCFASNSYFAEFFGLSTIRVSQVINKLKQDGWIEVEIDKQNANKRTIRLLRKLYDPIKENLIPYKENFKHNNIINNIINNNKKELIRINSKKEKVFNENDIKLTNLLFSLIRENFSFLNKSSPSEKDYAEMNKINRIDKREYDLIEFIIRWSQQDNFWKLNIRSVSKLRKQFETLMVRAKSEIENKKERQGIVL